jgi:phosphoribosyl-ATP pyrophosphohydrolase/phosphoribosyl-AMP cyclohydrolase
VTIRNRSSKGKKVDKVLERPSIHWDNDGLVPVIVQDAQTGQVLMLAYANAEAVDRTVQTGEAHFWSRSRQELWRKGAVSGNTQRIVEIWVDCDGDALLYRALPAGPACHTGHRSCFYRTLSGTTVVEEPPVLTRLETIIADRRDHPREGSYTAKLFAAGENEIAKKVGEEAIEVVVAAKGETGERLVYELADLVYHILVLLSGRGLSWADVEAELARRFVRSGQSVSC